MQIARQNLPDGTIKLVLTIPHKRVKEVYEKELKAVLRAIEIPGFRKGKVPLKIGEKKINKKSLWEKVARQLIPQLYQETITQENIKPATTPQIKLLSTPEDKDWEIEIQTCEVPEVKLGEYKNQIRKINAAEKIWVPDKEAPRGQKSEKEEVKLERIVNALLQSIKVEIPRLLIENEFNRRLANLIDKTEKLGLSLEQYLASTNQTQEDLRQKYRKASEEYWQLEFILNKIADQEEIFVTDSEIEDLIQKTKDEREKKALANQRYFLAAFLRRQKTLDFLLNL